MSKKISSRPKKRKAVVSIPIIIVLTLLAVGIITTGYFYSAQKASYSKFDTCSALADAFEEAKQSTYSGYGRSLIGSTMAETADAGGAKNAQAAPSPGTEYSTTNIQAEGVDEADIVKTDGQYIYTLSTSGYGYYGYRESSSPGNSGSSLVIASAYPAETAMVLSETGLEDFYPSELFIEGNKLLIFGSTQEEIDYIVPMEEPVTGGGIAEPGMPGTGIAESGGSSEGAAEMMIYPPQPYKTSFMTVKLFDIADRSSPELVRSVDFEGSYVSSRKMGNDVYFVVNSYPRYYAMQETPDVIVPLYRDTLEYEIASDSEKEFTAACKCADVGYFEPIDAQNFVTIASMSISDPGAEIEKEVIVGSGQNIYASLQNLYIAETSYPYWGWDGIRTATSTATPEGAVSSEDVAPEAMPSETTIVHKFGLDNGAVDYAGYMEAPGRVLNQFSMDEHNGYFRIATTIGRVARAAGQATSANNVYIFDGSLNHVGSIEDIAPGEQIYSARFMGDRGYLVTFKKIDPFFVIDLADPYSPRILGKLKIPGYSDYLHPYDENHIIGIGIETMEAEEGEDWGWDFAWFQGVKMAIFDVTDVSSPTQLHKTVIGDRGTRTEVSNTHKAFLFDRGKNLLVLPITLAEIPENVKQSGTRSNTYGDYVYQGAYVYGIDLVNGFQLKGRVTHYEDDDTFLKSGYYWYGGEYTVKRSLYIENVLYTISNKMIKPIR